VREKNIIGQARGKINRTKEIENKKVEEKKKKKNKIK